MSDHYVIIGNGATANSAADTLRSGDKNCRITLISDEFFPFYYRHMLCDFITGKKEEEHLIARQPSYYKESNIRLRLGQKVVKVDFSKNTLYLDHMEKVHFDKLLLATGGQPKIPETYYACQQHFTTIQSLADARSLKQTLATIRHIAILGGDLISVRIARALRSLNIDISFFVTPDSFWPLEVDEQTIAAFSRSLEEIGITVISNDTVKNVSQDGTNNYVVSTSSKKEIKVDLVGAFFGLIPSVDFLLGSGLDLERGIIVNEFLESNIDSVYAAGDCAQIYNPSIRNYWVSVGWKNAIHLGKVAGNNMLGAKQCIDQPKTSVLKIDGITVSTSWWDDL